MNVQFKVMRRSGDKAYILSEITGYDERLPVVLATSTDREFASLRTPFPIATIKILLRLSRF